MRFYRYTTQRSPFLTSPLCLCIWYLLYLKWQLTVLVCLGFHSQILQTGRLKQQTFIISQLWRLVIQNQGAIRVGFWWELPSWFVDGLLLSESSHREREQSAGVSSSSYKDTSPIRLGSHLNVTSFRASFNLSFPLKALTSNTFTLKVRTLIYEFGGGGYNSGYNTCWCCPSPP